MYPENTVTCPKRFVDAARRHFLGADIQHFQLGDGIDTKVPQVIAKVAPAVDIPVITVMHQALRRHFAFHGLAALSVEVSNFEAFARHSGGRYGFKLFRFHPTFTSVDDADAFGDVFARQSVFLHQLGQPVLQRFQFVAK